MTRKSAARQKRDEFKKNNKCWDDLKELYTSNYEALSTSGVGVVGMYRTPGIMQNVAEPNKVAIALKGLDQDIKAGQEKLNAIYELHKDRSGGYKDEDDLMYSFQIFNQYQQYVGIFTANTLQTIAYLMEEAEKAAQLIKQKEEDAKNGIEDAVLVEQKTEEVTEEKEKTDE